MKRLILSAAASVAALAATAPASATVYTANLGTVSVPPSQFFQPGFDIAAGTVDALFTFTLTSSAVNGSSFTSSPPPLTFNSVALYNGTLTAAPATGSTAIASSTAQSALGGSNAIALSPVTLAAGDYTIYVSGNAASATGLGSSISFSPAATGAVPEPGTWGMLLLGIGMVGAGLRVRRRFTSVSFG